MLEKVQEKFVKNVSGLQSGSYHDKLRELKLLSLKDRRVFLDLVELFKMIKGFTNVNYRDFFVIIGDVTRRETRTTDCPFNIISERCNLEIRKHFFTHRVAKHWNELPFELKMETRLNSFKNTLKEFLLCHRSG